MKKNNTTTAHEGKQDKGNGHTPGQWSPVYSIAFLQPNQDFISVTVRSDEEHGHQKIADIECKHTQKEEVKANAKLIASAPQLKAENEKLKEDKRDLLSIIQLVIDLTPAQFHPDNLKSVKYALKKAINKHQ